VYAYDLPVGRPQVNPKFMRQLEIFEKCNYQPSPTHEAYVLWKQKRDDELTALVRNIKVDTIVPEQFFLIRYVVTQV
jgi:hypothetical protein